MNNKFLGFSVLALLAVGCAKDDIEIPEHHVVEPVAEEAADSIAFVQGKMKVKFTDEMLELIGGDLASGKVATKSMGLNQALDELGIVSMKRAFPDAGRFEPRHREFGLDRWYVVEYDKRTPVTKAERNLGAIDGVEKVARCMTPRLTKYNDPYLDMQWGYINDGILEFNSGSSLKGKAGFDIGMDKVWNSSFKTGSEEVIVNVVDGGIDIDHPDLAANVIPGGKNGSWNFVDDNDQIVAHDHGTHVAGTIAAVNNNGIGVCGIAGGNYEAGESGVRLLNSQIFETDATGKDHSSDLLGEPIVWGADHGAVISQNSWGFVADMDDDGVVSEREKKYWYTLTIEKDFPDLKDAIDYFIKYAGFDENGNQVGPMAGGLVVFAAGNDDLGYDPVGYYDKVIAVGATSNNGTKASYSNHDDDYGNYGKWVDICAPGTYVASTYPGGYGFMSGTSMACPHVSGAAALLVANYGGPGFTPDHLRALLLEGAVPDAVDSSTVGPFLNVYNSLMYERVGVPDPVRELTAKGENNSLECGWTVVGGDDMVAYDYMVLASRDKKALAGYDFSNPSEDVISRHVSLSAGKHVGDTAKVFLRGLDFNSTYYVAIAAGYIPGKYSKLSDIVSAETGTNYPPVITLGQESATLHVFESATIPVSIVDKEGDKFEVRFDAGSSAASFVNGEMSGTYKISVKGTGAPAGTYTATITATDEYGFSSTSTLTYTILENQAPVLNKEIGNMLIAREGTVTLNPNDYFSDPDGETPRYTVSVDGSPFVKVSESGSGFVIEGVGYGLANVTITASDILDAQATTTFKVLVRRDGVVAETYPNPVTANLFVRTGIDLVSTSVKIVSSTGQVVFEGSGDASAFEPYSIDMTGTAPGEYKIFVSFADERYEGSIVKI